MDVGLWGRLISIIDLPYKEAIEKEAIEKEAIEKEVIEKEVIE